MLEAQRVRGKTVKSLLINIACKMENISVKKSNSGLKPEMPQWQSDRFHECFFTQKN